MDEIDSRVIERDGIRFRVAVHDDYDTSPGDFDCYTEAQKRAFRAGDWQFVFVTVTPVMDGLDDGNPGYLSDSLGGVEYGTFTCTTEDDEVTEVREIDLDYMIGGPPGHPEWAHPVPDMIQEVKASLRAVRNRLMRLPLGDEDGSN